MSAIQFSLAVHNAIGGIYSIQSGNQANLSAISAYDEPIVPVLLEAFGLLQESHEQVLCVIADRPLPEVYRKHEQSSMPMYSMAFLLKRGQSFALSQVDSSAAVSQDKGLNQVLSLAKLLAGDSHNISVVHNRSAWNIDRNEGSPA